MKLNYLFFTAALFIFSFLLPAQNEATKWYFGSQAGLDFATNPPTILANSNMTATEGSASIADAAGNLLFYTNSTVIYDKTHSVMANGSGLLGNISTTQSSIIIKQPGSATIYYVFTQDQIGGPNGLCYSVVDMSLAAGNGSVTAKNVFLYAPSCEKLTATMHCNGSDVWVVTHDWNSDNFRAHLVTAAGVNTTAVVSAAGAVVTTTNAFSVRTTGQMKISPNGKKLGLAVYDIAGPSAYELYDFDPATGIVSNPLVLGLFNSPYGCEFSPDGTKFYGAAYGDYKIFQWDLCAGTPGAIIASIYTITTSQFYHSALQVAPNGKIYAAVTGGAIHVINNPNDAGVACNFSYMGQSVAPKMCSLGLPNFTNSYLRATPPPFTYSVSCSTASFSPPPSPTVNTSCNAISNPVTGQLWLFGDPASAGANSSSLSNPVHAYSAGGTYTATLVLYHACYADTVRLPVFVTSPVPSLNVAGTFTVCKGNTKTYTVSGASTYSWSTSAGGSFTTTSISLTPTVNTTFTVTGAGTNSCSSSRVYSIAVSPCLGLNELSETNVAIFPNPFSAELHMEVPEPLRLAVYNINGSLVLETELERGANTINTLSLEPGFYTLKLAGSRGTLVKRFVKIE